MQACVVTVPRTYTHLHTYNRLSVHLSFKGGGKYTLIAATCRRLVMLYITNAFSHFKKLTENIFYVAMWVRHYSRVCTSTARSSRATFGIPTKLLNITTCLMQYYRLFWNCYSWNDVPKQLLLIYICIYIYTINIYKMSVSYIYKVFCRIYSTIISIGIIICSEQTDIWSLPRISLLN